MSSPAPFSDLLEANKLMEGALAGLMRHVDNRMGALEKKQRDDATSLRNTASTGQDALRDIVSSLKIDVALATDAHIKLASSLVDLSNRLTSIQGGLGRVEGLVTDLGEQYGNKDAEMNRDIREIKSLIALNTIRQDQSPLQTQVAHQQHFYGGMSPLSAGFARSQPSGKIRNPTNKSLTPLQPLSISRAISLEIEDRIQLFQPPGRRAVSAIKRTVSERQSEISEPELRHQRSGSLQRKRGRSDLREASRDSRESVRESSGENMTPGGTVMCTPSRLQNAFTPTQTESDEEEFGEDSNSESEDLVNAFSA